MRLQNVYGLDGEPRPSGNLLSNGMDCLNNQFGEKVLFAAYELAAHGCLDGVEQVLLADFADIQAQLFFDVSAGLAGRHLVPVDDDSGVNLVPDEVASPLEQLGGQDNDGGGAVAHFSVLELGKLDEHFGGRVLDLDALEDGGAVIGDEDFSDVVHDHFVQALRAKGGLDDVGDGADCGGVVGADVDPLISLALNAHIQ